VVTTSQPRAQVVKRSHSGETLLTYQGTIMAHDPNWIQIEAFFGRSDVATAYVLFRQGDRMVETFYAERWYNIFELHDVSDDHLKGWYCNITRPSEIIQSQDGDTVIIASDDLALDVFVDPLGVIWVLDEDEFAEIRAELTTEDIAAAQSAVATLCELVSRRQPPFDQISAPSP
jgi:predicted RNA-binding protein associated with RNAse of E/G family